MKKIYSILLASLLSLAIYAQVESQDEYYDPDYFTDNDSILLNKQLQEESKIQSNVTVGSMFMSGNGGNLFSSYVAPSLSYKMTDRFRLRGGMMFMQNNYFGLKNSEMNNYSTTNYNSLMFVQGEYLLNKNVLLRGTIIKDMNNFSKNTNLDSYSIGMDYKLGNNSTIGFDIQFSNGNQPYYRNSGFGGAFGNNHFMNPNQ